MKQSSDRHPENLVLQSEDICKAFPGVRALFNMNIDLVHGEVHAICGENGAGKSTLMKLIAGVYQPDSGTMLLNGQPLVVRHPVDAYAKGIAIIFQETSLFPELTILENIFMGHELRRLGLLNYPAMYTKARQIFDRLGMKLDLDIRVADLSVAMKQMVEIAKALSFDSNILILDEPTAALTSKEVDTLFSTIANLKAEGVSMLYISHRLDEIFVIADRVTVIRDGEYVNTEVTDEVTKAQLVSWMVGRDLHNLYPKEDVAIGEMVLEGKGLVQEKILNRIDLTLRRGEILGIAGLAGAGRTELALAICGLTRLDGGQILVEGRPVQIRNYQDAMKLGIAYVSEDRQKYGLVIAMTVMENITKSLIHKICNFMGIINTAKEKAVSDKYIQDLSIKTPSKHFMVNNLSGGNQQKVSLAKALATAPRILILDEPTRGVDVGAKSEIHRIISSLAQKGTSIIMISSDLPEILGMSDRVMVLKDGTKQGELQRAELSQESILQLAL